MEGTIVLNAATSRYSFPEEDISFQVLKIFPKGISVFVGFQLTECNAAGPSTGQLPRLAASAQRTNEIGETFIYCMNVGCF